MTGKKKNAKKLLNVNKLCKKQQVITRNVLTWGVTVGLDPFSRCISPSSLPHPGLSTSSSRPSIHPKSWILWIPESTDNFEFSAERLSENAKTIKIRGGIVPQIRSSFEHCSKRGGGSNPCSKILEQILYDLKGILAT